MDDKDVAVKAAVLVVGTGPAGGTAALALARLGVDVMVINKYPWTAPTPRAHITNQRTVEVLRDLGLADEALALATPNDLWARTLTVPASRARSLADCVPGEPTAAAVGL